MSEWLDPRTSRLLPPPAPRPGSVKEEDCPRHAEHTLCPRVYLNWHAWARVESRTHRQVRCEGCNLLTIWVPKGTR